MSHLMMLVCRRRPHRLAGFSFLNVPPARSTSTTAAFNEDQGTASTSQPADRTQDSIFTAPESPWDHVFTDVEPPIPSQQCRPRSTASKGNSSPTTFFRRESRHGENRGQDQDASQTKPFLQRRSVVRGRASLTAREMSVFDEMFDLIFNAVSGKDGKARTTSSPLASARTPQAPPSFSSQTPSIGRTGEAVGDLFRTLRRHTSRVRWTTAIDEELDRKKETMELFNTDHELLRWVTLELFGEAQRWDEEAKKAIAASSKATGDKGGSAGFATSSTPTPGSPRERPINHSIYPHLIAHAMRIFRTTYSNPSLSLAIFNHAARVSIPSYVFGCTAPAYNELIEAKWEGWGDLEGVCNALEEMRANGVKIDGRTRIVVETVRREVGEARPVELGRPEEDAKVNPLARRVWRTLGETEVMKLLHRIEQLALRDRSRKSTSSPRDELWKSAALQPSRDDGWSFDRWEMKKRKGQVADNYTR